jgi:hypothetical protein
VAVRELQLTIPGSSSVTISSQSDADNLSACDTLRGSVIFSSSVTGTITISNVEQINGAITAEGASGLTGLIAPDLDTLKGALTLDGLDSLTTLDMSGLSQVSSGITITGNSQLESLDFEQLQEVDGQLLLTGSFKRSVQSLIEKYRAGLTNDSVSLQSLDQVKGQTIIRGGKSMPCGTLNSLQSDGVFQGGYSCSAGPSSNALSAGEKGGIAVGVIVGVLLLLLLLWYMLRQRRQRKNGRGRADLSPSPAVFPNEKPAGPQYKSVPLHDPHPSSPSPPVPAKSPVPRKPIGPPPALLDGRSIHEAPYALTPVQEYHELDAGPVFGTHQRPINCES